MPDPAPSAAPAPPESGRSADFFRDLRTIPNIVSLARIVMIYAAIVLWYEGHFAVGLGIGVIAGLTDYADGILARRLGQVTKVGSLLDQAADVLFITGVLFIFVRDGTWPGVLLLIVLFREIVVLNLRVSAAQMGFEIPSIFLGKLASNFLFWSLAVMGAVRGELLGSLGTYGGYVAHFGVVTGTLLSLITGGVYLRSYARRYRSR